MVGLTAVGAPSAVASSIDPDAARESAREVLDASKYQEQKLPRPFKGALEWLADRLRDVTEPIGDALEPVVDLVLGLPGGRLILILLMITPVVALIVWLAGRRSRAAVRRGAGGGLVDLSLDPASLANDADRAEAAGDHALAVRRRYEAGLLRLVRADLLELRPETTPGAAARQVGEPAMDRLTVDFEEIVYGGRDAGPDDSARSRNLWAELVGARAGR